MDPIKETNLKIVQRIIRERKDLAFVVGNGINLFESPNPKDYSWIKLIASLWSRLSSYSLPDTNLHGISLTELYDIINLCAVDEDELVSEVLTFSNSIPKTQYHSDLQEFFKKCQCPVLTTNFDTHLEEGLQKRMLKEAGGFTNYYPWNVYFSDHELSSPLDSFGIWHVNGSVKYKRSMKLGLTQYMNMASRIKDYFKSGERCDYPGRTQNLWRGHTTWLHIVFNCNLLIFGLQLDVNETLLRWLLIERAKYFERNTSRRKYGWYVATKESMQKPDAPGKRFFLEAVGFEVIELDDYPDIYRGMLGI